MINSNSLILPMKKSAKLFLNPSSLFLLLVSITLFTNVKAQNNQLPYQWSEYLSFRSASSVALYNNKIYCSSTTVDPGNDPYFKQTQQGVFTYDLSDNTFGRLSRIQGLSDIDPVLVKTNSFNSKLLIAYANCNIDIISGEQIMNISDIKRKSILGQKTINNICFEGNLAYLATSFGIVVLDMNQNEIKDTYIIGPGGTNIYVYEVAFDNNFIYAGTTQGLFIANRYAVNLSDFNNWQKVNNIPQSHINCVVNFKGKIHVNYSKFLQNGTQFQDSLYYLNNGTWNNYPYKTHDAFSYHVKRLIADNENNRFIVLDNSSMEVRDSAGNFITRTFSFGNFPFHIMNDALVDPTDNNYYWIADKANGLHKVKVNSTSGNSQIYTGFIPNGPNTFLANDIEFSKNRIFIAPVFLGDETNYSYLQEGIYILEEGSWSQKKKFLNGPYFDVSRIAVDPDDEKHYYASCYNKGVLEYYNDSVVNIFTNTNSSLGIAIGSSGTDTRVNAVYLDEDKNLWVSQSQASTVLSVKDANNSWHVMANTNVQIKTDELFMDKNKQVWVTLPYTGFMVVRHDGSFNPSGNVKTLTTAINNGALPGTLFLCATEDKEGDIWIGTNQGIGVFYNPESIFTQSNGWDAQRIYIEQNGVTQILLEAEEISSIAIDGGNNKWIGTRSSGLYCFSPDGQKELFHFTVENSPLFSNNIYNVKVQPETGEVFIATEKGLQSFQNMIIEGLEEYKDVYAYPNPVKPGYEGPIMIKGLIDGTIMKISDIKGHLVYEAKCEGGQAVWNGKDLVGNKVASGVYLVFLSNADGSQKDVTKILVIR